ncbi:MAG: multidrug effflux MFS transporter [Steroidobacteraceae bacterium]
MKPALPARGSAPTLGMALLLATLSMVSPLSIDTFFPSFRAIAAELNLSDWEVQQTITAYLVPYACLTLIHGPLSDALGRRRMVIVGTMLYTLASIGCAFAPSFALLLVGRVFQGMAAGVAPTIARAVVRDLYDGSDAQRLMGLMMMIFSIAPALGPIIGGWLHVAFGWRAVFGFMGFVGAALVLASWLALPETHPKEKRIRFHPGELLRSTLSVARHGEFMLLAVACGCTIGAVLAYLGSAPSIVLDQWHLSETQFAWLFLPVISGFMLGSFLSNRLAGRWSRLRQLRLGFALLIGGPIFFLALNALMPHPPILPQQIYLFVVAAGAQLIFPMLTLEMLDLFPNSRGAAASVSSFITLGCGSIVMGVLVPALDSQLPKLGVLSLVAACAGVVAWSLAHRRKIAAP